MFTGLLFIGVAQAFISQHAERRAQEMQQPNTQGNSNEVRYTGHGANTGGLQAHSIGPEYPYTIIGVQTGPDGPLRWAVMDTRNGQTGESKGSHKECEIEIYSLKIRNMMHG